MDWEFLALTRNCNAISHIVWWMDKPGPVEMMFYRLFLVGWEVRTALFL